MFDITMHSRRVWSRRVTRSHGRSGESRSTLWNSTSSATTKIIENCNLPSIARYCFHLVAHLQHKMALRSLPGSSIHVIVQSNANKEFGSGLHGSELANIPTADLEDGEITEEEKSASRSSDTTPTTRTGLPAAEHSLTPPLGGSDGTWAKALEIPPEPEDTEILTSDLVDSQLCMRLSFQHRMVTTFLTWCTSVGRRTGSCKVHCS